jgi:hypothetical protein
LREATDLLAACSSGRRRPPQLDGPNGRAPTARQKQQVDHVRDLVAQQTADRAAGKKQTTHPPRNRQMVNDRQR